MDERPAKLAKLKIYGRLERSHIHYDRVIICEDGRRYESRSRCHDGYWGLYPSYRMSCPKTYLKGREHHGFYDTIDEEKLMRDIVDVCLPFQFNIESIKFYDIPFICPVTGISWQYDKPDKKEYNSHYEWKKLPKNRKSFIVCREEWDHIRL